MPRVFGHYVPAPLVGLATCEATIVFGSVYLGHALPLVGFHAIRPAWGDAFGPATVLTALVLTTAHIASLYDMRQTYGRSELLVRLATAFLAAYLIIAMLGYLAFPLTLSRKAFLLSFVTAFPASFLLRLAHARLTAASRTRHKVLLLGSGEASRLIAAAVRECPNHVLVGRLDDHGSVGDGADGVWSLGAVTDLDWVSKVTRPDVIVVALEERRGTLPVGDIVESKLRGIQVEDWPTFYEKLTGKIPIGNLRPSWLVFADGFNPTRLTRLTKRAIDLLVSLTAVVLSLPLLLVIAVAIRIDSRGPILFRQERIGQFGRVFRIFKFRSMRSDARPLPTPGSPDPRVTRMGRLLRRTRLDELPQLFNVIAGDMSLVGPRPEWVALVAEFREKVPLYVHRLAVKPGITGWAQVLNPYGATLENTVEKLQYDLYYIKNMSIFLDMLILLHTIHIVLLTRGSEEWKRKNQTPSTTSVSFAG
jgi:sugar transferase (PEP-CTERM system associated)